MRGSIDECITDRHKLRPLVGGEDDARDEVVERELAIVAVRGLHHGVWHDSAFALKRL